MDDYERFITFIRSGNIEEMKIMLDGGFEINMNYLNDESCHRGQPRVLYMAAIYGTFEVLEFLLQRGADPNFNKLPGNSGISRCSILDEMISESNTTGSTADKIELMLRYGANPEGSDSGAETLLGRIIKRESHNYMELLLRFGADPENIQEKKSKEKYYKLYGGMNLKPAK